MTFAKACEHMTNYSSGHESLKGKVGVARFAYPDNHIESDNRLSWMMGRLLERFGDEAFYVHLVRDREATAASFDERWSWRHSIVRAYAQGVLCTDRRDHAMSLDYWDTVNANIRAFLRERAHTATVRLEHAEADFEALWDGIGAEGDKKAALRQWSVQHNAAPSAKVGTLRAWASKGLRITRKLPSFLRNA
jgi:hypothetical protein